MTLQEQIAGYLWRRLSFQPVGGLSRFSPTAFRRAIFPPWQALPTTQELAELFLDDAEFQALQLGTFFGTTDGQIVAEAVGLLLSPWFEEEFTLLVEALKLAASLQSRIGRQRAGTVALGVGLGVLGLAFIQWDQAA